VVLVRQSEKALTACFFKAAGIPAPEVRVPTCPQGCFVKGCYARRLLLVLLLRAFGVLLPGRGWWG